MTRERGATTFLAACIKKTRAELQAILAEPTALTSAAEYHSIEPEWARFWIKEELNRTERIAR